MKRLALVVLASALAALAGCGGGGRSTPPPPPPVGGFSNADLNGHYAFFMSGDDGLAFFGRVGSFVADGNGHITGGVEDVNTLANGEVNLDLLPSTYTILADGRGTINLQNSSGILTFSVTLVSGSQGYIVQTDNNQTGSGVFFLQNTSGFTLASVAGNYVFNTKGIDPQGFTDSIVGQFNSGGSGTIVSGVLDENDDTLLSGAVPITSGTYAIDATLGPTFGRGLINLGGFNYIFYIVNTNHLVLMETGTSALTLGEAVAQTSAPGTDAAFTGSYAFLLDEVNLQGSNIRACRFTANGTGGLSGVALDENNGGDNVSVPKGTLSAMTYSVDPAFPGSGRVEITFNDSTLSQNGPYQFIAYMASATDGFVLEASNGFISSGPITAQTGAPYTNANLAGDYAFNWSGVVHNGSTTATAEADYVGHVKISSAAAANTTGVMDFSDFSTNQGFFLDIGLSGALTIAGDGTNSNTNSVNRNEFSVKSNNSPSTTYDYKAYVVNPQTVYLLGIGTDRVVSGVMTRQP